MKKSLIPLVIGIVLAMSCQLNEIDVPQTKGETFYAAIEGSDITRTALDNNAILWSAEDQISIFKKSTVNSRYEVTPSSVGESSGTFTKVHTDDDFHAGTELDHNVAAYPYLESLRIGKSAKSPSYKVTGFSLPATQTYVKNSFASGAFPMVAASENTELTFRNVCGGISLKLKGSKKITSIKIQGKNNEKLSGSATLRIYYDGTVPYIEMSSDASTSVTLDCGSGVQLNESKATEFIIVLPPLTFTKGFTVTVTDSNDEDHVIETSKSNEVKRSSLLAMPEMALNGIPSDPEPQEGDYIDEYGINHGPGIAIGNVVWAPVNCGYHETDYPYGKLYQWGRKYGQGYDGDATYPTAKDGTIKEGGVSLASGQSKSNEDVFFTNDYDWVYPSDDKLWNSGAEENPVKTEYDPCPEGWRVPTYNELKELQSNRSPWTENDKGQSGRWFSGASTYSDDVPQIFLPAAGYRSYNGNASVRGNRGCYWSSRPSGFFVYYLNFSSGAVGMSDTFSLVYGYSVRCIKEEPASPTPSEPEAINLSENGTANSYIVSEAGSYKFTPTKGNSNESVGTISSVEVLWESFGTDVTPNIGDLIKSVSYDGNIVFQTADTFKEGNAVIAAKDASGNILWSWHIWLTDKPHGQEYYNNAGTMMDRNLGATSATPGNVGALGLLYQWGRKDPFLGSSSISSSTIAKSTVTWPSAVSSDSSTGTIAYATANPTTFITYNESNYDWYYTGSGSTDNTRWTESGKTKSIYDPCPYGWRVPDGGSNGVWSTALGSSSSYYGTYDSANEGMNFSGKFGSASTIWYPASGFRNNYDGSLYNVGYSGSYWSASPANSHAYDMSLGSNGYVNPSNYSNRALGYSVRCVKEGSTSPTPSEPEIINLSENGTANSYIVSAAGSYKFTTVKGNSSESVGAVSSAEVLWETFGTDVTPNVGDLVKNVKYADGAISFDTPSTFKEGNAVIAAKDASGNILWSWHIWLTDEPQGQEYYNNAGTMMDRNLGATSATPGDVGALGLLYQWGRKDPFLGSSSISSSTLAASTITWPSSVSSDSSTGTIGYATSHPTTFITYNNNNSDWYYTGSSSTDNSRWPSVKTIYDPCPAGWRVPDGGSNGVWSTALGSSSSYNGTYDSTNKGMNFSGMFGSASTIWYPASGDRYFSDGSLNFVGSAGYYLSASPSNYYAYCLSLGKSGYVYPSDINSRAYGHSVRCVQEYSPSGETVPVSDIQLSHTSLDLQEGETAQLIATVIPSDATDKNVVWNSDTPSVATVDQSGLVTAVSSGTAIITATAQDGGKTASCTVSVVNIDSLVSAKFRNISFGNGGSMEYEGYYIKVTAGLQMGISLNNNSKHEITVTGFRMICGLTNTPANYSINETEISGGKSLNITVTIPFTMYAPIAEFTYRYRDEIYKARVQFNGSF